ncbi:MAG: hypothetical protein KJS66_01455 [Acidobacteria bacterium]|nr:hypothetical protein [Acidobacteriota bacterium]
MVDQLVVSDRCIYSTRAYRGYGQRLGAETIRDINSRVLDQYLPDIVVWIQLPRNEADRRLAKRNLDRFAREGADGFADIAATDPNRWIIIGGTPQSDVQVAIHAAVAPRLSL